MTSQPRPGSESDRPATFRQVFASTEVTALFASFTLSKASTMLARVAVTFLVFRQTGSALLATGTFAISYAPYLGPAQLLATLADRVPYRAIMIASDLLRMILIGLVGLVAMLPLDSHLALPIMLALLFMSATVEPAYQSARSALLPKLVDGDVLTLALSLYLTVNQSAVLAGYLLGGVISSVNPYVALFINSGCFAISALTLVSFVRRRPADSDASNRKSLLRETLEGFALVFGNRVLRIIALVVFTTVMFTIIPEGAAAPWAQDQGGGAVLQGAIMASAPVAAIISSIVFTRFTPPALRQKLIRPLVLIAPLSLIPAFFDPPSAGIIVIAVVCNLTVASLAPLNAIFVKAVPDGYRARAFSVMQSGMALIQGLGVIGTGGLTQTGLSVHASIGAWGLGGTILVGGLLIFWPASSDFDDAVSEAETTRAAPAPSGEGGVS